MSWKPISKDTSPIERGIVLVWVHPIATIGASRKYYIGTVARRAGAYEEEVVTDLDRNYSSHIYVPWVLYINDNRMLCSPITGREFTASRAKAWVIATWDPGHNYGLEYQKNQFPKI